MANTLLPDYSSKISFAPDTNFDGGFRSRRISSNAGLFNIRRVNNRKSYSKNTPGIPPATATETYQDDKIARKAIVHRFPEFDTSENPHLPGLLQTFPVPAGLDITTLCSYVGQHKPLLNAARNSFSRDLKTKKSAELTYSEKPVISRFPPLEAQRQSLVGTDRALQAQLKKDLPRKYDSLDSLNLYLRQSTLSLNHDDVDVFVPYRHVPNLVESNRRSKTFLQDNERIQMLQVRSKTDDFDMERLEAYKIPQGERLTDGFLL